MHQEAYLWSW